MKLGLSSYSYGWAVQEGVLDVFGLLEKAKYFGLHLLQIGDNIPMDLLDSNVIDELAHHANLNEIEIELGMRGFIAENILRYTRIACQMKAKILRIITDTDVYKPTQNEILSVFYNVESELEKSNIILAIENHDRYLSWELANIVHQANSNQLAICLDMINSIGAGEGTEVVLNNLGALAVNIHMKDYAIVRLPHKQGFTVEGRPAGNGMLNITDVLGKIQTFGRNPNVIVELWTPPEDSIDKTLIKEELWVNQSVAFLKGAMLIQG